MSEITPDTQTIHNALRCLPASTFVLTCAHDQYRDGLITKWVQRCSDDPPMLVVAIKKGKKDKRVMIAAHMDEIGFIVTHVDDNGFIYFHTLGGFDPKTLTAQRVIIHGKKDVIGVMGSKPIHLMNAADSFSN